MTEKYFLIYLRKSSGVISASRGSFLREDFRRGVHFSRFAPVPEGELLGVESEFLMEDFGEVAEIGVPYAIHYPH